jgi:hypothetical protein
LPLPRSSASTYLAQIGSADNIRCGGGRLPLGYELMTLQAVAVGLSCEYHEIDLSTYEISNIVNAANKKLSNSPMPPFALHPNCD